MRLVKVFVAVVLLAGVFLQLAPSNAKGPVDRILITGGDLKGEVVVDDLQIAALLSIAALEDLGGERFTPPANLGKPYELERQYKRGSVTYSTFDRVHYYPDPEGGRGYINYIGIENGSSGYDGDWFHATEMGDLAMQYALETAHLQPY